MPLLTLVRMPWRWIKRFFSTRTEKDIARQEIGVLMIALVAVLFIVWRVWDGMLDTRAEQAITEQALDSALQVQAHVEQSRQATEASLTELAEGQSERQRFQAREIESITNDYLQFLRRPDSEPLTDATESPQEPTSAVVNEPATVRPDHDLSRPVASDPRPRLRYLAERMQRIYCTANENSSDRCDTP